MLALCVLRIMFMAYLNAVTLFALCRGLVHGFRGKSLSIVWPFFIDNNGMIVLDAWNGLQGLGGCWLDHLPPVLNTQNLLLSLSSAGWQTCSPRS